MKPCPVVLPNFSPASEWARAYAAPLAVENRAFVLAPAAKAAAPLLDQVHG